jgi:hypothetical protein
MIFIQFLNGCQRQCPFPFSVGLTLILRFGDQLRPWFLYMLGAYFTYTVATLQVTTDSPVVAPLCVAVAAAIIDYSF